MDKRRAPESLRRLHDAELKILLALVDGDAHGHAMMCGRWRKAAGDARGSVRGRSKPAVPATLRVSARAYAWLLRTYADFLTVLVHATPGPRRGISEGARVAAWRTG
jgi:hypothetical protein